MQSGYERAINALVPALAGADELSGVGEMAGGVCSCNAQMVIDNDIFGMVKRVRRGFEVNADSLAVDVIAHAMDTTHNFLREPHTRKYLRSGEIWQGKLGMQESGWEQWAAAGSPTVIDRAEREAQRILAAHTVPPLEDEQEKELQKIFAAIGLLSHLP
jgi:trimethylamine--corrinoid protein Co-methyltransferase